MNEPTPAATPTGATPPAGSATSSIAPSRIPDLDLLKELVTQVMRETYDPEIPVNIYELGLVYAIDVSPAGEVVVKMTLTSPMCPVAGSLPPEVEGKIRDIPGVASARVDLVWDPVWNPNMMSEAAKLQLGFL